jgi:hypothetical protein
VSNLEVAPSQVDNLLTNDNPAGLQFDIFDVQSAFGRNAHIAYDTLDRAALIRAAHSQQVDSSGSCQSSLGLTGSVYLAAVLEYISAEMLVRILLRDFLSFAWLLPSFFPFVSCACDLGLVFCFPFLN